MSTDYKVIICAAIQNSMGQILLTRRKPELKLGGMWEFPGGKLEHGEELETALKREIREELSIEIDDIELLHLQPHVYTHAAVLILFYLAKAVSEEIQLVDHDKMEWVSPQNLGQYDLLPANQKVIEILKNRF